MADTSNTPHYGATPRTDAWVKEWNTPDHVSANFARQLERELVAMSALYAKEAHKNMVLMESGVRSETVPRELVRRAIELVLEDWPESHPNVSDWLKEARSYVQR